MDIFVFLKFWFKRLFEDECFKMILRGIAIVIITAGSIVMASLVCMSYACALDEWILPAVGNSTGCELKPEFKFMGYYTLIGLIEISVTGACIVILCVFVYFVLCIFRTGRKCCGQICHLAKEDMGAYKADLMQINVDVY